MTVTAIGRILDDLLDLAGLARAPLSDLCRYKHQDRTGIELTLSV
jgi:hypothetical protein